MNSQLYAFSGNALQTLRFLRERAALQTLRFLRERVPEHAPALYVPIRAYHTLTSPWLVTLTWNVCTERKRVSGFTATLPGWGDHVATGDIFTAVLVLRVPNSWGEKPSILFTSLTCCRSLLLRQSRDVAPPVWATRGGGQHRHIWHMWLSSLRRAHSTVSRCYAPPLRLSESANGANAPALHHTTPVRRTRLPSSEPLLVLSFFIDSNQLLGYYVLRDSLFSRKRENHATPQPGISGH